MRHVPQPCLQALEVGCGSGAFARLLAKRAEQVLALDVSPQMIRLARERSQQYPNITFHMADALSWEFPSNHFDCIVSIATLHHVPLEEMLLKMKRALRVNGVLLVLDLYQESLSGVFTSLPAIPINLILKYLNTGRFKEPPEVRAAWAEHGKHDTYLTLSELRQRCHIVLPGVTDQEACVVALFAHVEENGSFLKWQGSRVPILKIIHIEYEQANWLLP